MFEIHKLLVELASSRRVFHSEADFQHALAWQIHVAMPESEVRLEVDVLRGESRRSHDIWLPVQRVAIELKYQTRILKVEDNREIFSLRNQGAQDIRRYDFLRDIERLEKLHTEGVCRTGYAVLLTNEHLLWNDPLQFDTVDAAFRMHEGRVISGELAWGDHASDGTKRGREEPIRIKGSYSLQWQDYSEFPESFGKFRYVAVSVE